MPISSLPEHKIGVFVLFLGLELLFSGFLSTKSGFLCAFGLWNPHFRPFEHKIEVFVRFSASVPSFSGISSTKSAFLCSGRRGLAPGCVNIAFLQITAMQSCGQMLPAELATLPHRPWTPMSSVNGRVPASEAQREGWSEAEVCAEEVVNPQKPLR